MEKKTRAVNFWDNTVDIIIMKLVNITHTVSENYDNNRVNCIKSLP